MNKLPVCVGHGKSLSRAIKHIRMVQKGCTNRPFFHIVVTERFRYHLEQPIEQLGTYDPMSNMFNEKLVSMNMERIRHWLGRGALLTEPVAKLMGLAGYYPIHPKTYMKAWRTRRAEEAAAEKVIEAENATS